MRLIFNSVDTLYGIQTDQGGTALTHLVTINTSTGVVTNIGPTPDNAAALATLKDFDYLFFFYLFWFGA
jgi:hypothetical protein